MKSATEWFQRHVPLSVPEVVVPETWDPFVSFETLEEASIKVPRSPGPGLPNLKCNVCGQKVINPQTYRMDDSCTDRKCKGKLKPIKYPTYGKKNEALNEAKALDEATDLAAAEKYVSKTKNALKKAYAEKYLKWKKGGEKGESPDKGALSYMGAQAVRMSIEDYFDDLDEAAKGYRAKGSSFKCDTCGNKTNSKTDKAGTFCKKGSCDGKLKAIPNNRERNPVDFESVQYEEGEPTNVVGAKVAGTTGDPPGKPKKKKDLVRRGKFAGCEVFEVDADTYQKCIQGRKRYARWSRYFDYNTEGAGKEIRDYAYQYPKKSIIVKDGEHGTMCYLKLCNWCEQ